MTASDVTVAYDEELHQWVVEQHPTGPAGYGVREVVPGLTLIADIARPDDFCRIEIAASKRTQPLHPDHQMIVSRFAGPEAARLLRGRQAGSIPARPERDPAGSLGVPRGYPTRTLRASVVSGLAASEPDEPLWELELSFLHEHTEFDRRQLLSDEQAIALGQQLLDASPDRYTLTRHSARLDTVLEPLVRRLAELRPPLAQALLERGGHLLTRSARPAGHDDATSAPPRVTWTEAGELATIVVDGDDDRRWACVLVDGLIVGLAPLVVDGADKVAHVVVPAGRLTGPRSVVVTRDPSGVAQQPGLRAYLASTEAGRLAAHLERINHPRAADAWDRCAQRWRASGDQERAELARVYAEEARSRFTDALSTSYLIDPIFDRRPMRPFVADLARLTASDTDLDVTRDDVDALYRYDD